MGEKKKKALILSEKAVLAFHEIIGRLRGCVGTYRIDAVLSEVSGYPELRKAMAVASSAEPDNELEAILSAVVAYSKKKEEASEELKMGLSEDGPNASWWSENHTRRIKQAKEEFIEAISEAIKE